jgi:hypothetical protein
MTTIPPIAAGLRLGIAAPEAGRFAPQGSPIDPSLRRAFVLAYEALADPSPPRVAHAQAYAGETIARLEAAACRPSRDWDETSELIDLLRLVLRWVTHKAAHVGDAPAGDEATAR